MSQLSQEYLDLVRKVFEKKYKRKLTDDEVELFAQRLMNFAKVIQNFYRRKKEKYGDKYEEWYQEFVEQVKQEEYQRGRK